MRWEDEKGVGYEPQNLPTKLTVHHLQQINIRVNEGAIPLVWYGHLRVGYTLPLYTD